MIELFTAATPNGWKASIALEELGLEYRVRRIALDKKEQKENPNEYLPCLMPRSDTGGGFYHRLYRAIGLTYNLNSVFQVRPEIGYYRNWNVPAFDNGARQNQVLYGFDMTYRF